MSFHEEVQPRAWAESVSPQPERMGGEGVQGENERQMEELNRLSEELAQEIAEAQKEVDFLAPSDEEDLTPEVKADELAQYEAAKKDLEEKQSRYQTLLGEMAALRQQMESSVQDVFGEHGSIESNLPEEGALNVGTSEADAYAAEEAVARERAEQVRREEEAREVAEVEARAAEEAAAEEERRRQREAEEVQAQLDAELLAAELAASASYEGHDEETQY